MRHSRESTHTIACGRRANMQSHQLRNLDAIALSARIAPSLVWITSPVPKTHPPLGEPAGFVTLLRKREVHASRRRPGLRAQPCSGVFLAITCAWVVGCGTHKPSLATAPAATNDASADASADVSELGAAWNTPRACPSSLGGPYAGLDAALLARYQAGRADFIEVEDIADGIGPVFNEMSCASSMRFRTGRSCCSRGSRRSAPRRRAACRPSSPRSAPVPHAWGASAGRHRCRRSTSSPALPT